MNTIYYCPRCNNKLENIGGWGSTSYFCTECKMLISRSKILTKEQLEEKNTVSCTNVISKNDWLFNLQIL